MKEKSKEETLSVEEITGIISNDDNKKEVKYGYLFKIYKDHREIGEVVSEHSCSGYRDCYDSILRDICGKDGVYLDENDKLTIECNGKTYKIRNMGTVELQD